MPRKAATRKTVNKTDKPKKKTKKTEKKTEKVVEETPEVVAPTERKKRVAPTKESVVEEFDQLLSFIDEEITHLRESQVKSKGVKFLRSVAKRVKTLKSKAGRVMKQKNRVKRKNNSNSGFLKPVKISKEMAKFTGWDADELRSRVDVTKFICNYIKENDLQNPKDRRQILADNKLSKLLKYDAKKAKDPLTYYRIQSYMKPHFV